MSPIRLSLPHRLGKLGMVWLRASRNRYRHVSRFLVHTRPLHAAHEVDLRTQLFFSAGVDLQRDYTE